MMTFGRRLIEALTLKEYDAEMSILVLPTEALFPSHFTSVKYDDMEAGEPNIPKVTNRFWQE